MTMRAEYITAIETRLRWLKWATSGQGRQTWTRLGFAAAMPAYEYVLEHADTYYMNPRLAELVDLARQTVPDDLAFDARWPQSKCGFLWLQEPFKVPSTEQAVLHKAQGEDPIEETLHVRAIGWREIPKGDEIVQWKMQDGQPKKVGTEVAKSGVYQIITFQDFSLYTDGVTYYSPVTKERVPVDPNVVVGFGCWSYFVMRDGQRLGERVEDFETRQTLGQYGQYRPYQDPNAPRADRRAHPLHEIRWVYTALHLMAQRLSITVQHDTDRGTRRRAERSGQSAPPFIRVVTLRRMEQARLRSADPEAKDWQWQWTVRGHWRNQWYPAEGIHKPKFIEAYVKGPEDKPLKPDSIKLFAAIR